MYKYRLVPSSHIISDLYYGLQPFHRPLGEIIKVLIVLVTLQRVKLGELFSRRRAQSLLNKQAKNPDHVGPPIGRDLEDRETKILKNRDEEWVQWEPHSNWR